ncbi:MAG: pyridoxamine 5'-phosphate oxidase family protein [Streptosporangiaceae bacterium]|jgi:PPOX class probable F420-dependent enzyme
MTSIGDFAALVPGEHGLCVVSTSRGDGTIQSSVVNAGIIKSPVTGEDAVALVARGGARKLANLRERPWATIVIRVGWQWAAAEGPATLIGPDDSDVRLLLREIFTAAGGTHEDFATYDRVMAEERRTAVLITPERVYSNRLRCTA